MPTCPRTTYLARRLCSWVAVTIGGIICTASPTLFAQHLSTAVSEQFAEIHQAEHSRLQAQHATLHLPTPYNALSTLATVQPIRKNPCVLFNEFNQLIHSGSVDEYHGKQQMQYLISLIEAYYYALGGLNYASESWFFPVQNYDRNAIGGRGSGYKTGGYNYFTRQVAHPAHDIFIRDTDQDSFDDRTLQAVNIVSMSGGVVVAAEPYWDEYSPRKGGICVSIYDPASKRLFYYAHNSHLCVGLGSIVRPGQVIAQMGRTGANASMFRSPTHLHVSCHLVAPDGGVTPYNFYDDLCHAQHSYGNGGCY